MNDLHRAIDFTTDDLNANRQGLLSPKQREQFSHRQQRSQRFLTGVALIVALMLVGAVLLGTLGIIVLGIIALILGVLGIIEYWIGYQTYTRDLQYNQVEAIQGVVRYVWRGESALGIATSPSGIRVGDMQFLLLEDQARAFIEGDIYVLYYAPSTHTLLSAEQIYLRDTVMEHDVEVAYWESAEHQSLENLSEK